MIDEIVDQITKRHLEVPATLLLEMHKPLGGVGSQALIAFSPFLGPFFGIDKVNDWSRLIRSRDAVDRLIDRIDEKRQKPDKES